VRQDFVGIVLLVMAILPLVVLLLFAVLFGALFLSWLRAFLSGAPVSILQLIGMRFRGVPPRLIVDTLVALVHRGHPHDRARCYLVESTYLARRGLIETPEQLADLVEKQLKASGAA
jgi:uncharacterized protein YqfA (UPF0365 family)